MKREYHQMAERLEHVGYRQVSAIRTDAWGGSAIVTLLRELAAEQPDNVYLQYLTDHNDAHELVNINNTEIFREGAVQPVELTLTDPPGHQVFITPDPPPQAAFIDMVGEGKFRFVSASKTWRRLQTYSFIEAGDGRLSAPGQPRALTLRDKLERALDWVRDRHETIDKLWVVYDDKEWMSEIPF